MVKNKNYANLVELENTGRKLTKKKGRRGLDWNNTGYNQDMIRANEVMAEDCDLAMRETDHAGDIDAGEECADIVFTGNRKSFVIQVPWKQKEL